MITYECDYLRAFDAVHLDWRSGAPLSPLAPSLPELTGFHTVCAYTGPCHPTNPHPGTYFDDRAHRAGLTRSMARALQQWWEEVEVLKRTGSSVARARVLNAAEAVKEMATSNWPLPDPDDVVAFHRGRIERHREQRKEQSKQQARWHRYVQRCYRRGEAFPSTSVSL